MTLLRVAALAADSLFGRIPEAPCPGAVWGPRPERGLAERRSTRLAWRARLSGPGGRQAASVARLAANRVFAIESSRLSLEVLASMARRELATGPSPVLAKIDSLALAATAAQRCLGLRPHLPQLTAAALMLDERVAELPRGEGKTLALAIAAVVRSLAGVPVHVLVASDARAARDLALLQPMYRALGLSAATVPAHVTPAERGEQYRADICYASPATMMGDYLLDCSLAGRRLAEQRRPAVDAGRQVVGEHAAGGHVASGHVAGGHVASGHVAGGPAAGDLHSGAQAAGVPVAEQVQIRGLCSALVDDADVLMLDRAERTVQLAPDAVGRVQRLSTRSFFKRYWRLAGVSATVVESRREIARLYGVDVVAVKSIYPSFQRDLGWRIEPDAAAQRHALVSRVAELRDARRAVLIAAPGRAHLAAIHAMLGDHGIHALRFDEPSPSPATLPHVATPVAAPATVSVAMPLAMPAATAAATPDATPDATPAATPSDGDPAGGGDPAVLAGRAGAVSIRNAADDAFADVVPDPIARAAGGLALITLSLGANRRDDRQRRGWVGRQGQPGTVEAILDAGHALNLAGHRHPTPWLAWLARRRAPAWLQAWLLATYRRWIEGRQTGRRLRIDRAELRDPIGGARIGEPTVGIDGSSWSGQA
ncbi:MAG: hypothetical protein AB7P21_28955 [Lautropia sp.]